MLTVPSSVAAGAFVNSLVQRLADRMRPTCMGEKPRASKTTGRTTYSALSPTSDAATASDVR